MALQPNSVTYYNFILGLWLMCSITVDQINTIVDKGKLTQDETEKIKSTLHNCPSK